MYSYDGYGKRTKKKKKLKKFPLQVVKCKLGWALLLFPSLSPTDHTIYMK